MILGLDGHGVGNHTGLLADPLLDRLGHLRVVAQELLGVLASLADPGAVVGEPGAGLLDDVGLDAEVDQLAHLADALAVHDVELDLLERRRHLVLDHLDAGLVADDLVLLLDLADAPDVEAHRGVELQRVAAGGGLGAAEHHADLHPDLVQEDDHGVGARHRAGQLAQRLAHQPCVQADMAVAHVAFELGARHQGGDAVHHQHVDGARAHQGVGDLQRLLASVGLGDQQAVDVDAELAGVAGVERVLGVDEGAGAALLLRFGDRVQRHGGLAGAFRTVDLDHAAARQAADAECDVEAERAGGDHVDMVVGALPHAHDRALAEGPLDLGESALERLALVHQLLLEKRRPVRDRDVEGP